MFLFFRKHKTTDIVIDPTKLTDQNTAYLKALLDIYHKPSALRKGIYHLHNSKTKKTIKIILLHSLIKKLNEVEVGLNASATEYYVQLMKPFDKGSYGDISRALGTLVDHHNGSFSFYKKTRVVKTQLIVRKNKPNINAILEPIVSSFLPHLHAKKAGNSFDGYYSHIVMGEFKKQSLGKMFDDDSIIKNITSMRRLTITINLLRALCEQVHKHSIVHRDVKPDNIMIDKVGNVNFIDFGLSRFDLTQDLAALVLFKSNPDLVLLHSLLSNSYDVGTYGYISPEACMRLANDHASDVYSLGLLSLELWGLKSRAKCHAAYIKDHKSIHGVGFVRDTIVNDLREPAIHDFDDLLKGDLSEDLAHRVFATLKHLVAFEPNERIQIDTAIAQLEQIRLEYALTTVSFENHKYIHAAFRAAMNLRQRLDQLTQQDYFLDNEELKYAFLDEFAKVDDTYRAKFLNDAQAFAVFKEVLCINAFAKLDNFKELIKHLNSLDKYFWQHHAVIHALIKNIQYVLELKQHPHFSRSLIKLSALKLDLFLTDLHHLENKFQKRRIHVDDLAKFHKRMHTAIRKIEQKIYALIDPFFAGNAILAIAYYDRMVAIREKCAQQSGGVDAVKNAINEAILNFINELDSFHHLLNESVYQPHDRSQLIQPILELVMKINDEQELIDKLQPILNQLKVCSDYGRRLAYDVNKALDLASHQNHSTRRFKL